MNESTIAASLCFASQKECMPRCHENHIEPKLDDTQCGFCRGRSTTEQTSNFSKFSRNPGSMPETCIHVLSTSGKYKVGFLVKSFGGRCGSTVLTGASCWPSSSLTVFLLRRLCPCRRSKSKPFSVGVGLRQCCVLTGITRLMPPW